MNWEAIGSIAEIIGALAVVITLVFIARDIRQNSRSLAIAALRDSTGNWNQWSEMIATSPDLADIVSRGNRSMSNLSDAEALRYGAYVQSFFDNVESYRELVVDHKIEKDLDVLTSIVEHKICSPGFVEWWDANTHDYAEEFVAWINAVRDNA